MSLLQTSPACLVTELLLQSLQLYVSPFVHPKRLSPGDRWRFRRLPPGVFKNCSKVFSNFSRNDERRNIFMRSKVQPSVFRDINSVAENVSQT